jgi:glycosyltransferase involved in cell wall biosynthesis
MRITANFRFEPSKSLKTHSVDPVTNPGNRRKAPAETLENTRTGSSTPMRILLINQFCWPDSAATAQFLTDLADHLGANGESVTVICGAAGYGASDSGPGPQARILRLPNAKFSRQVAGRMGSYLTFLAGALWLSFRAPAPDVVVTLTTPPLLGLVGLAVQRLRGARHVIWEMDVYPDVATDLGVLHPAGLPARFFAWLANLPRHRADLILVLGECMRQRLLAHRIDPTKIAISHNWADSHPILDPSPAKPLSILYSGNLGLAHDADTLAQTLLSLSTDPTHPPIDFAFGGGGSRNAWLKDFCDTNSLVAPRFLPYCERHELPARLSASHIGLVTQKKECLGSAVPSKVYAILAAARPVLFIGPPESTPARIIAEHNCGWQIANGDVEGLVRLLRHLATHRHEVSEAGARAYAAFQSHYTREIGVARIASLLGLRQPAPKREIEATRAAEA